MVKDITDCVRNIEQDNFETRSNVSVASSKRSRVSQSSSKLSNVSKRAEAAAEAAMLKSKLKFLDNEAQKRLELDRITAMKELDMAEARLEAITAIESDESARQIIDVPVVSKYNVVHQYLDSHNGSNTAPYDDITLHNDISEPTVTKVQSKCGLNVRATTFVPNPQIQTQNVQTSPITILPDKILPPDQSKNVTSRNYAEFDNLASSFAKQVSLGRLPPPEPGIFYGDPLKYPSWKSAFSTLIEGKGIPSAERLYYLQK